MKKILIVEDEKQIGDLEAEILKSAGYQVSWYSNALDGYIAFQQERFDLVISDIMLPEMDGKRFCDLIRKSNADVPLLVISAVDEEYNITRSKEIGANDYIVKPFGAKQLIASVKKLINKK